MRRLNLILVLVLLGAPAAASAKVGVGLDTPPEALAPGQPTRMHVMLMREPGGMYGEPKPIAGARPLVVFRNAKTGEVVRVRAGRSGRDGIADGTVAFPSRGNWSVDFEDVPDLIHEPGQSLPVGIRAPGAEPLPPEVMDPAQRSTIGERRATPFPALPVAVALGVIILAAVVFVARKERPA